MSTPEQGPDGGTTTPPTCYRHPDRETYIRCSRCDRPICPECMNPAPVGFHCPECVRDAERGARQPRTVLGGEVRTGSTELVTRVLIGVQAASFVVAEVIGQPFLAALGLVGSGFDAGRLIGVEHGQLWRLVTASLVPTGSGTSLGTGLISLLFSLVFTWFLGRELESDLGRWRFLALWVVVSVASNAAALAVLPSPVLTFGGTGAAFGLLAATLVVGRRLRRQVSGLIVFGGLWLALTLLRSGRDWTAPVGGALAGAALAAVAAYAPRERRSVLYWSAVAALLVISVIGALLGA